MSATAAWLPWGQFITFWLDLRPNPQQEMNPWYCKSSQEPIVGNIIGRRGQTITVILWTCVLYFTANILDICNSLLGTLATPLCNRTLEFITTVFCYLLPNLHSSLFLSPTICSVDDCHTFWSTFEHTHMKNSIWYLSFCLQFILFNIMYNSINFHAENRISFFCVE